MTLDQSVVMLVEQLQDADLNVRLNAKHLLIEQGAGAVEALLAAVQQGLLRQQTEAMVILGAIGDPRAAPSLIALLKHNNMLVRTTAASALAAFKLDEVVVALLGVLDDEHEFIQISAVTSLGHLKNPLAVEPLLTLLTTTTSPTLCYSVIKALGAIGDPRAIDPILSFYDDANHHVRDHAHFALQQLGYIDA